VGCCSSALGTPSGHPALGFLLGDIPAIYTSGLRDGPYPPLFFRPWLVVTPRSLMP
jgi:hypothetical protein